MKRPVSIFVVAGILLSVSLVYAQSFFSGGGGSGGAAVTGQFTVAAGQGTLRSDGAMIPGPVGTATTGGTTAIAPSFTTDSNNVVVVNVFAGDPGPSPVAAPLTPMAQITTVSSQNFGIAAGYQILATPGASGAQTINLGGAGFGAGVTIPFLPVSGQTIGISAAATRLTTCTAAGGTTCVANVPSGSTAGDTLLACEAWYPGTTPVVPASQPSPASGAQQRWVNDGSWYAVSGGGTNGGIQCWHKVVASSEPANYTMSVGAGGVPSGFIADITNVAALDVPMTSASGTFSGGNAGNDLCIQRADTSFAFQSVHALGGQGCGQIGVVANATKIYPNFGNISSTAVAGAQYAYGPDQGAAIQAAIPSPGGHVILGTGIYMICGGNNTASCINFPAAPVIFEGQGRGLSNWGFAGGSSTPVYSPGLTVNNTLLGTYLIAANTDLAAPAAIVSPGLGSSINQNLITTDLRDLTLWGGVGNAQDGGGSDGLTAIDYSWLGIRRVAIGNFLGNDLHTEASGLYGYTDGTDIQDSWFLLADNDGWKTEGGATAQAQNEIAINSQFDNNGANGIELTGNHASFDLFGNNIQRNDNFNKGSLFEIKCNACNATGVVHGNYFENDGGVQNATTSNQSTGWTGVDWEANIVVGSGAFYPAFTNATVPIASPSSVYNGTGSIGVCVTDAAANCAMASPGPSYVPTTAIGHRCRALSDGTHWALTGMGC